MFGERHRVFCNSLADVFEDRPDLSAPRHRLWRLILDTRHSLDWLLLTKRPENFNMIPLSLADSVWLGVSVEDQATADERIPLLLKTPAAVRFVSCEPLISPVDQRLQTV
jgi:protein gp37